MIGTSSSRPTASGLVLSLRYEWHRVRTLRSSWVLLSLAALTGALAYLNGATSHASGLGGRQDWAQYLDSGFPLLSMFCGIAGATTIGQEYRHGTMPILLGLVPNRRIVYLSKALAAVSFAACAFVAAVVVGLVALEALKVLDSGHAATPAEAVQVLIGGLCACAGTALVSLGVTALTRGLFSGVLLPIALAYVLEPILIVVLPPRSIVDALLPFTAARTAMGVVAPVHIVSQMQSLGLFLGYVAVISGLGYARFRTAPID